MLRERRLERRQRTLALAVLLFVGERGGDRGRVPIAGSGFDVGDRHVRVARREIAGSELASPQAFPSSATLSAFAFELERAGLPAPIDSIWICVSDARKPV